MPLSRDIVTQESVRQALASYDWYGTDEALKYALSTCASALAAIDLGGDKSSRATWAVLHAWGMRLSYERDGSKEDVNHAKELLEDAVDADNIELPLRTHATYQLGRLHHALVEGHGEVLDLPQAQLMYKRALELCDADASSSSAVRDEILMHYSRATIRQSHHLPTEETMHKAILDLTGVVERTVEGHPLRVNALFTLASAHRNEFIFRGHQHKHHLLEAERAGRAAVAGSRQLRCHQIALASLCGVLEHRYWSGDPASFVKEAADFGEEAAEMALLKPWLGVTDRLILSNVGNTFLSKMSMDGVLANLEKAARYQRRALSGNAEYMHRAMWSQFQHMLCSTLCAIFEETGDPRSIDEAVVLGNEALEQYPDGGNRISYMLQALGIAHALRYAQNGEDSDFLSAASHLGLGVERAKIDGHVQSVGETLRSSSFLYGKKFRQDRNIDDLDKALDFGQTAIDYERLTVFRPHDLSQQGELFLMRYELTRDPNDLQRSLSFHDAALEMTVEVPFQRHNMLGRQARSLRRRYEITSDSRDINQCISNLVNALQLCDNMSYLGRSLLLSELAAGYQARYSRTGSASDLGAALQNYSLAADDPTGATKDRLTAATAGAMLAYDTGKLEYSAQSYQVAVSLWPRLAWLGLNTGSRQKRLVSVTGQLACDAAAVSLMVGHPERAVELLDEGRSVLWRTILELRSDVQDLRLVDPELANNLVEIGRALEYDDSAAPGKNQQHEEQRSQRRRRLAEAWEERVRQVRTLPGFESFLRPAPYSHLRHAAAEGPVVIINVSKYRTDVLIISPEGGIRCIPVEELSINIVRTLARAWQEATMCVKDKGGSPFVEQTLLNVCRQLWQRGFSRIAAALQEYKNLAPQKPFRVWWLPTGLLSLLPIHCAGPHEPGKPGIHDLFVSSYTTTLSALIQGRHGQPSFISPGPGPFRMLAISQPEAPGHPFLPSAQAEMQAISESKVARHVTYVSGASATAARFSSELSRHNWLHCCCHGRWQPSNPLDSAFHLSDGPYPLSSIVSMRLRDAQLAFLSACHTARHTALLPDESLTLSSGMQIAGFRGVVATQWAMADRDGPPLTRMFYRHLTSGGLAPDPRKAAEALHTALQQLRRAHVPLYRWALFVHVGI